MSRPVPPLPNPELQYSNVFCGELPPLDPTALQPVGTDLQRRLARVTESPRYWLLVIPEDGQPQLSAFEDVPELLVAYREASRKGGSIYAFLGYKLGRSKGPLRHLLTPLGRYKMFDIPDESQLEEDDTAFHGTPLPTPQVTAEESGERRAYRAFDLGDELDDDDDDEESDVFDD